MSAKISHVILTGLLLARAYAVNCQEPVIASIVGFLFILQQAASVRASQPKINDPLS
jgi:hypothetical protein